MAFGWISLVVVVALLWTGKLPGNTGTGGTGDSKIPADPKKCEVNVDVDKILNSSVEGYIALKKENDSLRKELAAANKEKDDYIKKYDVASRQARNCSSALLDCRNTN